MSSVGDIARNRQYRGWHIISKVSPKIHRKWILLKARKRIQLSGHLHCEHILIFIEFPLDVRI